MRPFFLKAQRNPILNTQRATPEQLHNVFIDHRQDLYWLALFLTGDEITAEACIVDACALATTGNKVFAEWLEHWARRSTVRSAIDTQKGRIAQLAASYERRPCSHRDHQPLAPESITLLRDSGLAPLRMDALCRFAIVLRGIEGYSAHESALLLNISRAVFDAAYCAAMDTLTIFLGAAQAQPGEAALCAMTC